MRLVVQLINFKSIQICCVLTPCTVNYSNGLEEPLEEHIVVSEPEPEPTVEEVKPEPILEEEVTEEPVVKSPSPPPADPAPVVTEDSRVGAFYL